jgi:ubiquinone/menaquinone biosynthesis C-methylase UbiE
VSELDEIARYNQQIWEKWVRDEGEYTRPWLELTRELIESFVRGEIEYLPQPYRYIYPRQVFEGVAGKDVLCLATGGGQQSAVFGLLGAAVTVLDLTDGQLAGDRRAAEHHGYPVTTIQGDMRDLSCFADNSFDLVYQEISLVFIPDVREVYREVARILRPGCRYRVGQCNPATFAVRHTSWDGAGYRIFGPYVGGRVPPATEDDAIEFRHLFPDIFNGLVEAGLAITGVWEDPRHLIHDQKAEPGTIEHVYTFVQDYFCILAEKPE